MVASAGGRASRVPTLAKYDVLEELGHGGMATVYRAHDKRLARDVAVKVLHPHLRESREIAHRFAAEAKAVAKLRHRNIVEVFDVSSADDEEQYLVVELVRGLTLRKVLQKHGALPPEIGAAIAIEILSALAHAHSEGVVHRDVKPENVLVEHRGPGAPSSKDPKDQSGATSRRTPHSSQGERVAVKLTDFGIAKLLDAQGVTSTGQVLGSPAHMAPEQIEGGEVDGRADVFGLGVLLYECIVGHLPFEGNNPAQVLRRVLDGAYSSAERERPIVGKPWSLILDRALARKPDGRYPDATTMREALSAELGRLGYGSPRVEIEAWLDDPAAWQTEHEKRLIAKLCALGAESRKRGDAVAAAADYNRALAYAPTDPQLLKIVSSMHRAEARIRMVKRVGPLVLGAIVLGTAAYFVASALRPDPVSRATRPDVPTARASDSAPVLASDRPPASSAPPAGSVTVAVKPSAFVPIPAPPPTANGKKRNVTITTLRPPFGVHMALDGAPQPDPHQDMTIVVDEKPHTLAFTCEKDMCEPRTIAIAAGDKNEQVPVELRILPAKLLVEGDVSHSYGIEELPNVTVAAGAETEVPMRAGQQSITVFDRSDPTQKRRGHLRAGKREVVSFKATP